MDVGKVGTRKIMAIPLGEVRVKGQIDFSTALPKPILREPSASPTCPRKSQTDKSGQLSLVVESYR